MDDPATLGMVGLHQSQQSPGGLKKCTGNVGKVVWASAVIRTVLGCTVYS